MRKLLFLAIPAVLASPVLAQPALAQNASGTVSIDGSVAGRCLFTVPNQTISLVELLAGE
ncbi:MAG: hypothetical protein RL519_607 [Pseudomonadota bacterium]|jgi:hypothetical protein